MPKVSLLQASTCTLGNLLPFQENKSDVLPVLNCFAMHFWAEVFSSPHSLFSCTQTWILGDAKNSSWLCTKQLPFCALAFPMLLGNPAPLEDSDLFVRHICLYPCVAIVYSSQSFWLSEEGMSVCCNTHPQQLQGGFQPGRKGTSLPSGPPVNVHTQ